MAIQDLPAAIPPASSPALTTSATTSSTVGNYAITEGTLSAGGNYTISFTPGILTIAAASGGNQSSPPPASFTLPSSVQALIAGQEEQSLVDGWCPGGEPSGKAIDGDCAMLPSQCKSENALPLWWEDPGVPPGTQVRL